MAEIKKLQMSGKTEDAIVEELSIKGYGVEEGKQKNLVLLLIKVSMEDLSTPEIVRKREYESCLKESQRD